MDIGEPVWKIGVILLLILLEAVVTASEAAIYSVSEGSLKKRKEGDKRTILIQKVMEQPVGVFHVIEVVLTGTSLLIGAVYSAGLVVDSLKYAKYFETYVSAAVIRTILSVVFTLFLLYVVILFGSILPRKLVGKNPEKTLEKTIYFVWFLIRIWKPFIWLLENSTAFLLFLFRIHPKEWEGNVTEEEIISMVKEGHVQGILEDNEVKMISNIIELNNKEVRDIMAHRTKVVGIVQELSVENAIAVMLEKGFSRYPVYEKDIDNIVGILHLKDLMKYYLSKKDRDISLRSIAREPYFVPDTQSIDVLFGNMQLKKIHMAVAVDEYGQTAGIVAMEDIIEEIVGNILDEYDVDEKWIIKQGEGKYLIGGMAPLEEMETVLKIHVLQEDYDTLNGFLISLLGHIPDEKERVNLSYGGYRFQIIDVKDNRISYVRVTKEDNHKKEDNSLS